eukprot:2724294-Pyramimonas_sp.AAC.1
MFEHGPPLICDHYGASLSVRDQVPNESAIRKEGVDRCTPLAPDDHRTTLGACTVIAECASHESHRRLHVCINGYCTAPARPSHLVVLEDDVLKVSLSIAQ